jgi:hypothetical protein
MAELERANALRSGRTVLSHEDLRVAASARALNGPGRGEQLSGGRCQQRSGAGRPDAAWQEDVRMRDVGRCRAGRLRGDGPRPRSSAAAGTSLPRQRPSSADRTRRRHAPRARAPLGLHEGRRARPVYILENQSAPRCAARSSRATATARRGSAWRSTIGCRCSCSGTATARTSGRRQRRSPTRSDRLEFYVYRRACFADPQPMRPSPAVRILLKDCRAEYRRYIAP